MCRSGVAISGAVTVGLFKTFGVVAKKVSVDFCCEKGILLYVSAMLAALQVLKLCETNN